MIKKSYTIKLIERDDKMFINEVKIIHPVGKVYELNFLRDFLEACGIHSQVFSYYPKNKTFESLTFPETVQMNQMKTIYNFCILDLEQDLNEQKVKAFANGFIPVLPVKNPNNSLEYLSMLNDMLNTLENMPFFKAFVEKLKRIRDIYFKYDLRHYFGVYNFFSYTSFFSENKDKAEEFSEIFKKAYDDIKPLKEKEDLYFNFYMNMAYSTNSVLSLGNKIKEFSPKRLMKELEEKVSGVSPDFLKILYSRFLKDYFSNFINPQEFSLFQDWYSTGSLNLKYQLLFQNRMQFKQNKMKEEYLKLFEQEPSNMNILRKVAQCDTSKKKIDVYNEYYLKILSYYRKKLESGMLDCFEMTIWLQVLMISNLILLKYKRKNYARSMLNADLTILEKQPFNSFLNVYYSKDQQLLSQSLYQFLEIEYITKSCYARDLQHAAFQIEDEKQKEEAKQTKLRRMKTFQNHIEGNYD